VIHQTKQWFARYERVLIPGALILGTAVDFLTFKTLEIRTAFELLGVYAILACVSIAILNTQHGDRLRMCAKFCVQFTFGALLSASLVFYWYGGAFSVSWPVMLLLAILMISNEVLQKYYLHPVIQMGVLYFVLFSLFAIVLPFTFNSLSPMMFIGAGIAGFIIVWLFVLLLKERSENIYRLQRHILFSLFTIFMGMNALYVANIIPPIPLSLREAGVYHTITRTAGGYTLSHESESFLDRWIPGEVVHVEKPKSIVVFSSIFAPTELRTTIYHRWQKWNAVSEKWEDQDRIAYQISGGRSDGYRGYTIKSLVSGGKWRVRVETPRGQVLGDVRFFVETGIAPKLSSVKK